jgi:RNA polymerase sigma factor (TIGR02999 family)
MEPVTELLNRWTSGDQDALEQLIPVVQSELHHIAHRRLQRERDGHTLQTTALVNEAYLRLVKESHVKWQDRAHFFAIAAKLMRRILVDYARRECRKKRGGGVFTIPFEEQELAVAMKPEELIALNIALEQLASVDSRKAQVVELRYFGGLNVDEVAAVIGVHPNSVIRDWRLAKVWLKRELIGRACTH